MALTLETAFQEIAVLLVLASAVGLLGVLLRQPLVVSFIAVGILAGPAGFDIARSTGYIHLLAELGIAVLLFLVGLKLDLHMIRNLGKVSLITGLGQVAFTSAIGFLICLAIGLSTITSAYVAVALTFSSTIIIVKLLSDKREIDSLHGRIALGFLIVQDLVVVLAMVALSAIGIGQQGGSLGSDVLRLVAGSGLLLGLIALFMRYAAEPLLKWLAKSAELMVFFAIGWAALLAAVADVVGLGKELGGLLAGVSLASTSLREAMSSRLSSLRDFLLLFFFISLGTRLELGTIGDYLLPAIGLSVFVLIGNPLIVMIIMGLMGYRKRTGFLAGLTVAQISEFSLIFMAMGLSLGHVDTEAVGLVTVVGLITIALSTYMIVYSQTLYQWLEPLLSPFERRAPHAEVDEPEADCHYDVLLFGLGRYGTALWERLTARGMRVLGIDFDPQLVSDWQQSGRPALYGDMLDPDFPANLPLRHADWVVSTVPVHTLGLTHIDPRLALLHALRNQSFGGRVAVTSFRAGEAEALRAHGADLVLRPFDDAADQAIDLLLGLQPQQR
jgi:Kef-type K+ transport system membrane component KefB/voltage-gated potassium channel Kch